jgi:hypothetical protein
MRDFLRSTEGISIMLLAGLIFFTLLLVIVAFCVPSNERLFTYMSTSATGFGSAFFTWISTGKKDKDGTTKSEERGK